MAFILTSSVFTSCSDDDDNLGSSAELVGIWESVFSEGWEIYNGKKKEWSENDNTSRIVFNKDNTMKGFYKSGNTWEQDYIGTWEYKGGKIYATISDPEYPEEDDSDLEIVKVLELTSSKLVIETIEEDYYDKTIWKKIND